MILYNEMKDFEMCKRLISLLLLLHICSISSFSISGRSIYGITEIDEFYGNDRAILESYAEIRDASKIITYIKNEIANATSAERVKTVLKLTRKIDNKHKERVDQFLKNYIKELLQNQPITRSNKRISNITTIFHILIETGKKENLQYVLQYLNPVQDWPVRKKNDDENPIVPSDENNLMIDLIRGKVIYSVGSSKDDEDTIRMLEFLKSKVKMLDDNDHMKPKFLEIIERFEKRRKGEIPRGIPLK